jgi:hypothetical protein
MCRADWGEQSPTQEAGRLSDLTYHGKDDRRFTSRAVALCDESLLLSAYSPCTSYASTKDATAWKAFHHAGGHDQ